MEYNAVSTGVVPDTGDFTGAAGTRISRSGPATTGRWRDGVISHDGVLLLSAESRVIEALTADLLRYKRVEKHAELGMITETSAIYRA